jgi:glutamate/tyrosine decarboxylase-like PLP-dependent enzyme
MKQQLTSNFADMLGAIRDKHDIRLDGAGSDAITTWFLGPKGENGKLMQDLVGAALEAHLKFRRDVYPEDPKFITPAMQAAPDYKRSVETIRHDFEGVLKALQESGAFFSMRSQGHMLWDVTIPSLAGYFAAMLYNQNNVAAEASPVTTMMEIAVGDDLCRMLGYWAPHENPGTAGADGRPRAWGHITCDGSIANMEGLWMARNLKFYPSALLAAARDVAEAAPILGLEVPLLDKQKKILANCTAWELLNLPIEAVVNLPALIEAQTGITTSQTSSYMAPYTVSALGMGGACQEYIFSRGLKRLPVLTTPATKHYSWPKGAALLGLGTNQQWDVHVDLDARQEVDRANRLHGNPATLRAYLQKALDTQTPIVTVVAVIGSTEESAVDPLHDIVQLRDEFRDRGLEFTIHADAAWGGYFASMLRERDEQGSASGGNAFHSGLSLAPIPETPMSDHLVRQYLSLGEADSITVDPHKAGYIPYPAGGLCYRDSNMRNLVSLKSPVVFHGAADPTVGVYGIEGSKPGAAAAAVYMSHKAIRPTRQGYGKLLEQCIFSSKKLYARLRTMARPEDPFCVAFVQRIPAERDGFSEKEIELQLQHIRDWFVDKPNAEIVDGPHYDFFKQLGSDQTILTWAANFKNADGTWNQDVGRLNDFNTQLYMTFSMMPIPSPDGGDKLKNPSDVKLILTSSSFGVSDYGPEFVESFLSRLGIKATREQLDAPDFPGVDFNISTQMDPWFTEDAANPQEGFLKTIEDTIRGQILLQIKQLHSA